MPFNFVIIELYNNYRYGYNKSELYFLYYTPFMVVDTFNNISGKFSFDKYINWYKKEITSSLVFCKNKTTNIRNYKIVYEFFKCSQQIVEKIRLPSGETICILKTFWLRIIQRKWKKIYLKRKQLFHNVYLRQIHGKLTFKNVSLPSLRGMLSDLFDKYY